MFGLVEWHKRELDNIRKEMDDLFDRFFKGFSGMGLAFRQWAPCLDLIETGDRVIVRVELPGLEAEDLNIFVHGDVLTIKGEKRRESLEGGASYRYMERTYGSFARTIHLPCMVQSHRVEATYKNGVLTISMPKRRSDEPKQLRVKVK